MAQEQGLYGECKRFEVALATKTFEDLVEVRKDFYKKAKQKLSNSNESDKYYGICMAAKQQISSGQNWSTNKFIKQSIDDLIEAGANHKKSLSRISETYKMQWDELDIQIKKMIKNYRASIEDTLRNTVDAEVIHKNLQVLRRTLQQTQENVKQFTNDFLKNLERVILDFCNLVDQIWSKMKKKEPQLFSTKDNDTWQSDWFETISSLSVHTEAKFITNEIHSALDDLNKTTDYIGALLTGREHT